MRSFLYSVFMATILCLLTYAVFGIYYEEYQSALEAMFDGTFTEGIPWDNFFYMAYLWLGHISALLAKYIPGIMWHDWLLAISMWLSVVIIFASIWARLQNHLKTWQIILLNVALFVIFIVDNVVNFQFTRVAFFVCGASFVWFALLLLDKPFKRAQWPAWLLCSLFFAVGLLIRIESGILLFAFILIFVFARKGLGKEMLLKTLPFLIPTALITGSVIYDIATTDKHYKLVETGAEYEMTLGNVVPVSAMHTTEDSMRYMGLRGGIVNDAVYVPYSFIKSILAPKSPWQIQSRLFTRAIQLLGDRLSRYRYIVVINLLLLLSGLWLLRTDKFKLLRVVVYIACFGGMLFAITYKLKMEHRLLSPFLFFFTVGLFFLIYDSGFAKLIKNKGVVFIFVAVGLYAMAGATVQANHLSADYKMNIAFNQQRYAAFERAARGKIVVPDFHVFQIMYFDNALPFRRQKPGNFKKVFQLDISAYSLIEPYKIYLDTNCKCNSADLGAFFDYLHGHKQEFVFAGEPERIQLFESYLNIVHHKQFIFDRQTDFYIPNHGPGIRDADDTLSLFTFR